MKEGSDIFAGKNCQSNVPSQTNSGVYLLKKALKSNVPRWRKAFVYLLKIEGHSRLSTFQESN